MKDPEVAAMLELLEWGAKRERAPRRTYDGPPQNMLQARIRGYGGLRSSAPAWAFDPRPDTLQEAADKPSDQE